MAEVPPNGWRDLDRWRGGVDQRLAHHDDALRLVREDLIAERRWQDEHEREAAVKEGAIWERINQVGVRLTRQEERMRTVAAVGAGVGGFIGTLIGLLAAWLLDFLRIGGG